MKKIPHNTLPAKASRSILRQSLEDTVILLGAAGIITLFCQVIDVSAQKTAAYSLAATLLVACCMYKSWINRSISSALVIGLLVGLAAIFFFNFQNILLKDTGLVRRLKDPGDILGEVGNQINDAHHEIWMFGVDFYITSAERKNSILDRLKQGVTVRYLILNPFSLNFDQVAKDFDEPAPELKDECLKGLKDILYLRNQWKQIAPSSSRPGELEIRLYDCTPNARIYVFDPNDESGRTIYIPYMNRVESSGLPGYFLQNSKNGVYSAYFGGVQKFWTEAQPIDAFLVGHPELNLAGDINLH